MRVAITQVATPPENGLLSPSGVAKGLDYFYIPYRVVSVFGTHVQGNRLQSFPCKHMDTTVT